MATKLTLNHPRFTQRPDRKKCPEARKCSKATLVSKEVHPSGKILFPEVPVSTWSVVQN